MATSFREMLAPAVLLLTSLACGCHGYGYGDLAACPGVAVGAKYELQIGAGLDGASGMCAAAWGFAKDNVFTAEIVGSAGQDTCNSGVATLSGNGGWNLQLKNDASAGGGALVESDYAITRNGCSGSAALSLGCDSSCLAGNATACACRLSINAEGPDNCPAVCRISVAASVTRL
jgi:hypothetical protein